MVMPVTEPPAVKAMAKLLLPVPLLATKAVELLAVPKVAVMVEPPVMVIALLTVTVVVIVAVALAASVTVTVMA